MREPEDPAGATISPALDRPLAGEHHWTAPPENQQTARRRILYWIVRRSDMLVMLMISTKKFIWPSTTLAGILPNHEWLTGYSGRPPE